MHSHFRVSWDYDTVMTKGRMTPVAKEGDSAIHTSQKTKGLLNPISNQHWIVSFWLTLRPSSNMGENILKHLSSDYNFSDHIVKCVQ